MTKKEFLKNLREYLKYDLPESYVQKHEAYYDSYIDEETEKGRSIDEVLSDLGDPQLIARTIIDAEKSGDDGIPNTDDDKNFLEEIYGTGDSGSDEKDTGRNAENRYFRGGSASGYERRNRPRIYIFPGGGCLGFILFLILFNIFLNLMGSALNYLSPVLGPLIVVLLIWWLLSRRR